MFYCISAKHSMHVYMTNFAFDNPFLISSLKNAKENARKLLEKC
jgi:hypothetical protein